MSTVTGSWSLAVPENDGIRLLDGDGIAVSVTTGGIVSIVNVAGWLVPGALWIALCWVAIAVYCPSSSRLTSAGEDHSPPVTLPLAVSTGVPCAAGPL